MSVYGFEMGLSLTFTRLDEINETAPKILEKALKKIYSTIVQLRTSLFETTDYKFYAREEILNRHRDYLVKIFNSERTSQSIKELIIRLIIIIGNLRSSGEDYLIAYNMIAEASLKLNLDAELSLNKHFQESLTISEAKDVPAYKINENNHREIEILTGLEIDINYENYSRFAFDKKHIYIFNRCAGMFKIGLNQTITSTPGYLFSLNNTNLLDACSTLAFVNESLVYRHGNEYRETPIEILDLDTLEQIDSEEFKANVINKKRNLDIDEWNKPIMEFTQSSELTEVFEKKEQNVYRSMQYSPVFTEGEKLYFLSTYFKAENNEDGVKVAYIEVESYDFETWDFLSKTRLVFKPLEVPDTSQEKETLISEETERIKQELSSENMLD